MAADTVNPPPPLDRVSLDSINIASGNTTPPPPCLPQLPYSLRDHKKNIAIIWTLLALDAVIMPLALFYPLWYASDLDPAYIFAVTTGAFGTISGVEWCFRSWMLWSKEELRPFDGKRYGVCEAVTPLSLNRCLMGLQFDFFHISYTIGYGISLVRLSRLAINVVPCS